MKRIIALIVGALFAVFSNLSPILPKDEEFMPDGYYEVTTDKVDYKDLYQQYAHNVAATQGGCDKSVKFMSNNTTPYVFDVSGLYWPFSADVSGDSYRDGPTNKQEVIAPCDLVLETSPYSSEAVNGTLRGTAVINGTTYRFSFFNLHCWYCCIAKDALNASDITTHKGNNFLKKGDTIAGGTVLGLAKYSENNSDERTKFIVEVLTDDKDYPWQQVEPLSLFN